jgi:Periplasmic binding protein domain
MRPIGLGLTGIAITASLATAACGSSSSSTAGGTAASAASSPSASSPAASASASSGATGGLTGLSAPPTALPVTEKLSAKPPTGVKVAVMDAGDSVTSQISAGLAAAGQALGWQVKSFSINQSDPASLVSGIDSAASSGYRYIVNIINPATEYAPALPKVKAAKAEIIDLFSSNPSIPGLVQTTIGPAWGKYYGAIVAKMLVAQAASEKTPVDIGEVGFADSPFTANAAAGIASAVATCSTCTVNMIDVPLQTAESGGAASFIVSYLQTHPKINYLLFQSSGLDIGLIAQLHAAGRPLPKIYGADAGLQSEIQEVQNGTMVAWSVFPAGVFGWIAADTIARLTVGDNANIWNSATPLSYIITKANASGVNVSDIAFPAGYQQQFEALWHVG